MKWREALLDSNKEVDLKVNWENSEHMFMSLHQNAGQNHNVMIKMWQKSNISEWQQQIKIIFTNKLSPC